MFEDFRKQSEKQKERRQQNKYPHRISRLGYAGLAEIIKYELSNDELIDRAIMWKRARMDMDGEYEGEELNETVKKIDECIAQLGKGLLKFDGPAEDCLSVALGKAEHSGPVRAVGGHVPPTVYFGYAGERRHADKDKMNGQHK